MMQHPVAGKNNYGRCWLQSIESLHLFYDRNAILFWFLFLLLLFWKEAGIAFVENKLKQLRNINIKNPGQTAGILRYLPVS